MSFTNALDILILLTRNLSLNWILIFLFREQSRTNKSLLSIICYIMYRNKRSLVKENTSSETNCWSSISRWPFLENWYKIICFWLTLHYLALYLFFSILWSFSFRTFFALASSNIKMVACQPYCYWIHLQKLYCQSLRLVNQF